MDLKAFINSAFSQAPFIEELYQRYQSEKEAVDLSWLPYFKAMEQAALRGQRRESGEERSSDCRSYQLIDFYRRYGHLYATVNPISLHPQQDRTLFEIKNFGFKDEDLTRSFATYGLLQAPQAPLKEIIEALNAIYCGAIGFEFMDLEEASLREWLKERIEKRPLRLDLPLEQKKALLQCLNRSELFETFLHTKFVGQKRFSIEGAETLIAMMSALIDEGSVLGIEEFVVGMPHRGRLNVLCNLFDKSYGEVFAEFEEHYIPTSIEGSSDVKYHKGYYSEVKRLHGHKVRLTLVPNPSHLESVDAVALGQTRAKQDIAGGNAGREKVLALLIHGDAALAGQGVVYETLQLNALSGYSTGGTIHFVINNQIGFTTLPKDARSTTYCTDIAKAFGMPVFHVNAEDPEGCIWATLLALEARRKFGCDLFIDLNCYRKYGHNEGDEPAYTQPLEYQLIRKKRPIRELYRDLLIQEGLVEKSLADKLEIEFKESLNAALQQGRDAKDREPGNGSRSLPCSPFEKVDTALPLTTLREVGERLLALPQDFSLHPKLASLYKERSSMLHVASHPIDWGMAEMLAYGTLLWQDLPIRLVGQDVCRGTFSHRHALIVDQKKEQEYIPLQHLKANQGRFTLYNSPLCEYAALGFEFGYSVANQGALVLWEAQFGDFANVAQVVIDQYIATAELKWGQRFSLVLLLPHGFEGQGPEHSSARMERFLTLCAEDNMRIANPSTPSQFYHLLRRQALNPSKKPLIVFTPKALLRHPRCISTIEELSQGAFEEILEEKGFEGASRNEVKRLVFCSGHVYYDALAERDKRKGESLAFIRLEQLYPLDKERLKAIVASYSKIQDSVFLQEEPSNMGAWNFVRPQLEALMPKGIQLRYVGRPLSASPAVGSHARHKEELAAFMSDLYHFD